MQPLLSPARKKLVFGVVLVAAVLGYVRATWLQYSAYRQASTQSLSGLRKACKLQPANAENWQLLGAYQLLDLDAEGALKSLRRSAELNSWDSRTWVLLATIYEATGDRAMQSAALDAAYTQDPKTPAIAWQLANLSLVRGDTPNALRMFRTVVENDPEQRTGAFRLAWQATHNIDLILADMIPDSVDTRLELLAFTIGIDNKDAAAKVWKSIVDLQSPLPPQAGCTYFDYLIKQREVTAATHAWSDMLALRQSQQIERENLIYNGDFEEPITGCGFDWHYNRAGVAPALVDSIERKTGTHSLSVEFLSGGAPPDVGLFQYVPVAPGAQYELTAFMKSEDIQSSSGPRLGVFDAFSGKQYALTDDLLESNVWREMSAHFTVDSDTHLVAIRIVRVPGNTLIKGKLWVDDVRLGRR